MRQLCLIIVLLSFFNCHSAPWAEEYQCNENLCEEDSILVFSEKSEEVTLFISDRDTELPNNTGVFRDSYPRSEKNPYKFNARQLIIPGTLITVGSLGLTHWWKKNINNPIKDELQRNGHHRLKFDNFTQLLPAVAGYGMNLFGFKGMHNVVDATIIYATTYILVEASVLSLKGIIHSPRPNLKDNNSFPSGHTANAFAGAELLLREYWNVSPWIGVAGYLVAGGTAFMRLYNNAHWLNDVIAGAGIGILCAEAAYWLYPVITKTFFKKRYNANVFLAPSVSTSQIGVACSISL